MGNGMRKEVNLSNSMYTYYSNVLKACHFSLKKKNSTNWFDQRIIYFLPFFFFPPFARFHEFINKKMGNN